MSERKGTVWINQQRRSYWNKSSLAAFMMKDKTERRYFRLIRRTLHENSVRARRKP